MSEKKAKKKSGCVGFVIITLPLLAGLTFFLPPLLILFAGMIPTLFALMTDRNPDRSLTACVGAFNFFGAMYFVLQGLHQSPTFPHVLQTLKNPMTILIIMSASAVGWVFYYIIPPAAGFGMAKKIQMDIKSLEKRQADLKAEWGDEVAQ